ncbi:hypothetical protein JYT11_00600 [Planctomycetaceae bacterium AH-315-I19]|nr:hypothetical protein [Planctomycetaceae bacterium AH-315-I19]
MSSAHVDSKLVFERENIYLPESGRLVSNICMIIGALLTAGVFAVIFRGDKETVKAVLHSYHAGMLVALGIPLGAMIFVMINLQVRAGWMLSIRRQFENMMKLIWVGLVLFLLGAVMQIIAANRDTDPVFLFKWMDSHYTAGDVIYESKAGYLNLFWFCVRAAVYFAIWLGLSFALWTFARQHDKDKDKAHVRSARKLAAVGIVLFAFSTAFASFDWIMSLDFHWFSTMFGVFFFAGNILSALTMGTLILIFLRARGRLHGAFTVEHLHDLGKLIFGFTVFWAYISFSQYFLIWYANIPEETAYFLKRKTGDWELLSYIIPIAGFIVPFLVLLFRPNKRSFVVMGVMCVWLLVVHVIDMMWYVRAEAGQNLYFIDLLAVLGPILFFLGMLIRQVGSGPLMPLSDPRMQEALEHKNYV